MKTITKTRVSDQVLASFTNLPENTGPLWWIRLTNWEFWPFNVFYFPVYCYAAWLMLKSRSLFFFSASNPGIEYGGMLGESKNKIFDVLPEKLKPVTILLQPGISRDKFLNILSDSGLDYPFILKPDIGERGWMVKKIQNEGQISAYLSQIKVPFLLQEYIDLPIELGIFYCRMPDEQMGNVTSIVMKDTLKVTGDGSSDIEDLLLKNPRARIALKEIMKTSGDLFQYIPEASEEVEVVPIGNHCRGTTFLNGNPLINHRITRAIDEAAKSYPGFYYGRFDIRCSSIEDLENGRFKIMELNGSGAEPGHVYQPGYPILKAYRELMGHLDNMYRIAKKNKERGIPYMTFSEGFKLIKFLRANKKLRK